MRIGWHFAGPEKLGMSLVDDEASPWYGITPVPRMLQNQLNHQLELKMAELDEKIMKNIMTIMKKAERKNWLTGTLALFFLLHIREIDAGRNFFWNRYEDKDGFWIHPSKPRALIAETVASSNCLLTYFYCTIGRKPLEQNWDSAKSKKLVDNNEKLVDAIKALQLYIVSLDEKEMLGKKACDVYQDGDAHSVAFTISSLLFQKPTSRCEVSGFH
ncbi:hypothetical protein BKA61DRAFT_723325 [Leptodontidium sp. MPI-SDFR-AT-0119]|nr:hypothetical protein BKA61DRAFT_723325 [Leptodontidium sp. MPI-SDFR-AT-0119]